MVKHRDFPEENPGFPGTNPLIRSLGLLLDDADDMCDMADLPPEVLRFLALPDAPHIRGLFVALLYRWHDLQPNEEKP